MIKIKISELSVDASDVSVEGNIVKKEEVRTVNTRFGPKKVCSFTMEDDSGQVDFSLWEADIDNISEGDTVKVTGAFVKEWQSKLQLNIPKSGTCEKV